MSVAGRTHLRAAVVGCGKAAQLHISSLLKARHAELVAVCDVNEQAAQQTAARFGLRRWYADLSHLLQQEHPDVVHITTPPPTHLSVSTQAMNAGCHALVEKPLALNVGDADAMIEVARSNGVRLCVVHNQLFVPAVLKARHIVDNGGIGDVVWMTISDCGRQLDSLVVEAGHWCHGLPGGVFSEGLPHTLYLATAFLRRLEPKAVYTHRFGSHDWLAADELRIVLEGDNSVATITASVRGPRDIMAFDLVGTRGTLHVSISHGLVIRYRPTHRRRLSHGLESVSSGWQWLYGTASVAALIAGGRYWNGHYRLIESFIESLREGSEPPVAVEDGREVVRLYEAIGSRLQAAQQDVGPSGK